MNTDIHRERGTRAWIGVAQAQAKQTAAWNSMGTVAHEVRWWSKDTVAVVTGANKGIGFEIARQLAENGITTVLTARDKHRGLKALEALKKEGLQQVAFHLLDVTSEDSARTLANWLRDTYGGIDILVNNAGILKTGPLTVEDVEGVIRTNYDGVKRVTEALLPILRHSKAGARIVVVGSRAGLLQYLKNKYHEELADREHIEEATVNKFIDEFLQDVRTGTWASKEKGWSQRYEAASYNVSKIAVNAYVSILHRTLSGRPQDESIAINSYCPGATETDLQIELGPVKNEMTFHPASEGADTGVWLALQPPGGPSGKFWAECQEIEF